VRGLGRLRTITTRVDEETVALIEFIARKDNTTKSEVVRRAINLYVLFKQQDRPEPRRIRVIA
jgi:predicted transcriptional regulator